MLKKNMRFSKHVEIWKVVHMSNECCCDRLASTKWEEEVRMMMQAGGMSVILGLVEATQRVSFHPGALLWGRSWTSGLFGGYKARSELPKLVERCMKGVSNLFIYTYKFPYNLSVHPWPSTNLLCSFAS